MIPEVGVCLTLWIIVPLTEVGNIEGRANLEGKSDKFGFEHMNLRCVGDIQHVCPSGNLSLDGGQRKI